MIVSLFSGPGGMDEGARVAGLVDTIYGYDIDADACATAEAAGHRRTIADVSKLDPDQFAGAECALITPPCPPFSRAGLGGGHKDFPAIADALRLLGDHVAGMTSETAYRRALVDLVDPRSALVVEALRWPFFVPSMQWVIAEQVPGVTRIWQEVAAELAMVAGWCYVGVVEVAAEDLSVASRRTRTFMIAARETAPDLLGLPVRSHWHTGKYGPPVQESTLPLAEAWAGVTMAQALGWPRGEYVNTRGNRRATGGNVFSADRPAWCLTEKARTWYRVSDGLRLTPAEAGLLMGFQRDYPWQGSRSKSFLQIADAVSPVVAAAVIGAALGLPWQGRVRSYLSTLYPSAVPAATVYHQPTLFEEIA